MSYAAELQARIDQAVADRDKAALDALLDEHYRKADSPPQAFDAAIELKPEYEAALGGDQFESAAAMRWANRIARARRRVDYSLKMVAPFDGLRIVDEGDSWFQYPLLLEDTIDHLATDNDKAIYSLSAAGDLLQDMVRYHEYLAVLRDTGTHVLLLSGGGNDLLGSGRLGALLLKCRDGSEPADLLHQTALRRQIEVITGQYRALLAQVNAHHQGCLYSAIAARPKGAEDFAISF